MPTNLYANVHQNFDDSGSISLFIFGNSGDVVNVEALSGFSESAIIGADGSVSVDIPQSLAMSGTGVNQVGLQISSDGDISAYLSNRRDETTDLSVIFEESSLGRTHVLASAGDIGPEAGQFSAQAIVDNTQLQFTLPDGQTGNIVLNAGETFKFSTADALGNTSLGIGTAQDFDLTGTIVSANQPIAVFSGHACANVGEGFCDHLVEQMPPVESLSQSYVVAEASSPSGLGNNLIRVVAADNDTDVTVDGNVAATLNQGEFHEFTLSDPAAVIETSKPALVAQYLQGATTAGEGDPALSFVPGTDTWLSSYIVATPSGANALAENLINIVIPTSAVASLRVNDTPVDPSAFSEIAGSSLSVANLAVDPGLIRAEADEDFQLSLFGYDEFDSYLTFGGASFASGLSNVPPEAIDDAFVTRENTPLNVPFADLLANDRDLDGDLIEEVSAVLSSENGTAIIEAGAVVFTPDPGFVGEARFTYEITDSTGLTDTADVVVTVEERELLSAIELILPDGLAPGETGKAELRFTVAAEDNGQSVDGERAFLFALSAEDGLFADPLSRGFSDTVFVLARGGEDGVFTPDESATVEIPVKGTAGPRSTLEATAQLADSGAITDIAARVTAFQPGFVDSAVAERIEANLMSLLGETVSSLTDVLADHADRLESFGLNAASATGALAFAIDAAGDYGSLEERGKTGSLGQGWSTLADIGLDIDGTSVQMRGLPDMDALRALSLDAAALYTVSNSAGRSVSLSGDVLALTPPARPRFEQDLDGQFRTTSAFDGTLVKTDDGFAVALPDGDALIFDGDGNLLRMTMPDGLEIVASHDAAMRITGLSGPNDAALTFTRDGDGKIDSVEDADGRTAEFSYDGDGLLDTVTRAEGQSSFDYHPGGDLAEATAPGGISGEFTYDAFGRLERASYGNGAQTEDFAYGGAGRLTITDGAGRTTQLDLLPGSVVGRITDGADGESELIYDAGGNLVGVRAPDGTETGFAFDDQDRLTKITDANGAELSFTYGETGDDPQSFTDAGDNTRSFDYDAGGRITQATWPDGTTLQFGYDDQGNLTGYTNRRGGDVTYTYDSRGRLLSESDSSAGPTTYVYDDQGRLASATNDQGTTWLAYDEADRVTQIDYPTGKSLLYTYNDAGLRASISDGGDYNIFYDYDALGRLTGLRDEDDPIVAYVYDGAGNLVREDNGNGTVSIFTYDDAGRVTRIENQAPDASINSFNAYTYDAVGQRVTNESQDGTWTYGYDAIGQLTSAVFDSDSAAIADKNIAYEYDLAGNRTRVVEDGVETLYTVNALNQYTRVGGTTFTYDDDGNMTSRTDGAGTTTYTYDLDNRLTSVAEADGTVLAFEYDAFGNRVGKTVDGVETEYLVDPFGLGDVVSEFTGGSLSATYAHGLGLAAGEIGGADAFYDADAVGSVTTLTGVSGGIQNRYGFTPFGSEHFEVEALTNSFEFNGALGVAEDSDELSYMRARSYSDELGRFISSDPLFLASDSNLYRFVFNNPADNVDPSGENLLGLAAFSAGIVGLAWFANKFGNDPEGDGVAAQLDREQQELDLSDPNDMIRYLEIQEERRAAASEALGDSTKVPKTVGSIVTTPDKVEDLFTPEELNGIEPEAGATGISSSSAARNDGDPHLGTFDGTGYSFQAVGEFTMVLGDEFEMQTRMEAINDFVSVNTATVMNTGDDVVGIYAREDVPLFINGTPVVLEREQSIAVGDGSVHRGTFRGGGELGDFDVYVVTDANGNGFWVNVYFGANHLRPFVAENSEVSGLLGNLDGDRSNDFALRDGTVLPQPLSRTVLYGEYADSWRISQEDSLFLYGDGESTETFTDRNFPISVIGLDDLDPADRAAAEAIAIEAGLEPGTFAFETTVLDIVLTGDPIFAEGVAGAPIFAAQGEEVEIIPVEINESPVARNDEATVDEDDAVDIDVLTNDEDPEEDPLTVSQVDGSAANAGVPVALASGALVTLNADGTLSYDPNGAFDTLAAGETAPDSFTYTIDDGNGNTDTATVSLTIAGKTDNSAPIAQDDLITFVEGADPTGNVLADNGNGPDSDPDGDPIFVQGSRRFPHGQGQHLRYRDQRRFHLLSASGFHRNRQLRLRAAGRSGCRHRDRDHHRAREGEQAADRPGRCRHLRRGRGPDGQRARR